MSGVLVVAEARRGELRDVSLELIGAARTLGQAPLSVAVVDHDPSRYRQRVRPRERVVPDSDASARALREAGEEPLRGLLVPDGDDHDLVGELQSSLQREVVPLVQGPLEEVGIHTGAVVHELEVLVDDGHLLHRHDDPHRRAP